MYTYACIKVNQDIRQFRLCQVTRILRLYVEERLAAAEAAMRLNSVVVLLDLNAAFMSLMVFSTRVASAERGRRFMPAIDSK